MKTHLVFQQEKYWQQAYLLRKINWSNNKFIKFQAHQTEVSLLKGAKGRYLQTESQLQKDVREMKVKPVTLYVCYTLLY